MTFSMLNPHLQHSLALERLEDRRLLAITFAEHVIRDPSSPNGNSIYPADMDSDGDVDMIFATERGTIGWYENTDGRGSFTEKQAIETAGGMPALVHPADLDGDGDMDVLHKRDQQLVWFENTDGQGNLGETQYVGTPSANWPNLKSIYAADLDNDGDLDALSASYVDDKIAWYENVDGRGSSWQQQVITTGANGAVLVYAADLDGDGDQDVVSVAGNRPATLAWYENNGDAEAFGRSRVVTTISGGIGLGIQSLHAADLDGDGDLDLLSANVFNSTLAWHENTDGRGTFASPHVITSPGGGRDSVYAADLDNDGDLDVIAAYGGASLLWYENTDGRGSFDRKQIISNTNTVWTHSVHATDVDADGDQDVICVTAGGFTWYENLSLDPVPQSAPGDVNGDFQFDQVDIVDVLQTAKYLTDQPATWQEGDWNDDGVFNQLDIVAALQTGNYLRGPYAAFSPNAKRETISGESDRPVVDDLLAQESELDGLLSQF